MVTEITEVHVFDYGTGVNVWTLFVDAGGTYLDGRFEPMADGDEMMRCCASFLSHDEAAKYVRRTIEVARELTEHVTVFRHTL